MGPGKEGRRRKRTSEVSTTFTANTIVSAHGNSSNAVGLTPAQEFPGILTKMWQLSHRPRCHLVDHCRGQRAKEHPAVPQKRSGAGHAALALPTPLPRAAALSRAGTNYFPCPGTAGKPFMLPRWTCKTLSPHTSALARSARHWQVLLLLLCFAKSGSACSQKARVSCCCWAVTTFSIPNESWT